MARQAARLREWDETEWSEPELSARLSGEIDEISTARIAGWVQDRNPPHGPLEVDIFREGKLVATLPAQASKARNPHEKRFALEFDPPLEPGFEFTIEAKLRAPDGDEVALEWVGSGSANSNPATRLAQRNFQELMQISRRLAPVERQISHIARESEDEDLAERLDRIELHQARIELLLTQRVEQPRVKLPTSLQRFGLFFGMFGMAALSFLILWLIAP